jgi:hypothetical protein
MTTYKLFLPALLLISAGACLAQSKPAAPLACDLKAFQPEERRHWRQLLDQLTAAVVEVRELSGGYALHLDTRRMSVVDAAQWIDLERRCCPFFNFQLDLHGDDGTLWLSLAGREGVKQFIMVDFRSLRDKLRSEP